MPTRSAISLTLAGAKPCSAKSSQAAATIVALRSFGLRFGATRSLVPVAPPCRARVRVIARTRQRPEARTYIYFVDMTGQDTENVCGAERCISSTGGGVVIHFARAVRLFDDVGSH